MNQTLVKLGIYIQKLGAYKESDPPELEAEASARMWKRSSGKAQVALQNERQRRIYYQREHGKMVSAVKTLLTTIEEEA